MSKASKILMFTTDFPPAQGGGILSHSHFLVDTLRHSNFEFCVLSEFYLQCSDSQITEYSKKEGFPIYRLPSAPNKLALLKKICYCYRITKRFKPDIIIGSGRHPVWFAALISFMTRIPLITIGHGTEFTQITSKYDLRINKWTYGRSNLLIAISEHTRKIVIQQGIKPELIKVIHNPANDRFFRIIDEEKVNEFKKQKGIENRRIILTVGSLSERKGQRIVIESLPSIKKSIPNILYVAIGTPSLKEKFIDLAQKLNVEEHILFPGLVHEEEVLLWMNACELFTMTSVNFNGDYEGFGIAVIEAAFCGKTSIVSDNGGLKEAVFQDETGLVVPEGNVLETSKQIIRLLSDEKLRIQLSQSARFRALKKNTFEAKGSEVSRAITDTLKKYFK